AVSLIAPNGRAIAVRQRAVMLDEAFERLPSQVQPVEGGITALQGGHDPERLRIVVEPSGGLEAAIERALAGMSERWVPEVVRQRKRFGQILVEAERAGERARNLRNFKGMRQPRAVVIALVEDEDLRLVGEPAECVRVNDTIAIAAKIGPGRARWLCLQPSAAAARVAGIRGAHAQRFNRHLGCPSGRLTNPISAHNYQRQTIRSAGCVPPSDYSDRGAPATWRPVTTAGIAQRNGSHGGMDSEVTTGAHTVTITERAARRIGE